jgi:uncharacterized protein
MFTTKRVSIRVVTIMAFAAALSLTWIESAPSQPQGKGKKGGDASMKADMEIFHYLLDNRAHIKRTVKNLDDGVETVTESGKAEVAKKIQEHAEAMHKRVKIGKGIRLWDPLFVEIFKHYDKVAMKVEKIDKGVKVKETSTDPYVAKLIQAHADVVSKFIANGYEEAHKNHPVPPRETPKK